MIPYDYRIVGFSEFVVKSSGAKVKGHLVKCNNELKVMIGDNLYDRKAFHE